MNNQSEVLSGEVDNSSMEIPGAAEISDRLERLEATLDLLDEGVAILDEQSHVTFWNKAAAALTGHPTEEMISRPCPEDLYRVDEQHRRRVDENAHPRGQSHRTRGTNGFDTGRTKGSDPSPELDESPRETDSLSCPTLVTMCHKLGHSVPAMVRKVALRDSSGESYGAALLFYPAEEVDALPHGESGEGADIERSQADMEDRLDAAHHQWKTSGMPFGLLWITIDQAQSLRRTHGRDACEAMLHTVEQTLLRQMKPAEVIGRWGNNEFLVLAHERTTELLLEHARRLAGLARTADFRWWGDRVGLTVSIGASHASEGDTLQSLLNRARQAMQSSEYAGGNRVTEARNG
jgi:diguanylate cyclase (GGDEF)-like protein/PAS domain S-box-containing protein